MEAVLNREPWWSLLLRGIFILILGIALFAWLPTAVTVLMIFLGIYVLVDGIFATVISVQRRKVLKHWWLMLLGGVIGIVLGILILAQPLLMAAVIFYVIGIWAIVMGIIRIVGAIRTRKEIAMGLPLTLGILSLCFGLVMLFFPAFAFTVIVWIIAAFAIIMGIFLIVGAIVTRSSSKATS